MTRTDAHRSKRNLIAQWLWDFSGETDDAIPYGEYWDDAEDLMKFLRAHGCEIRITTTGEQQQ